MPAPVRGEGDASLTLTKVGRADTLPPDSGRRFTSAWSKGMPELPSGTVTFLLTDVEGSTALWEEAPEEEAP